MCRLSVGFFFTATRDHIVLPVFLSKQITRHSCAERSAAAVPAPYSPGLNVGSSMLLTAVVRNSRLPETIGEECASPGTGTLNNNPFPVTAFQSPGNRCPSATPEAWRPRKDDQSAAVIIMAWKRTQVAMSWRMGFCSTQRNEVKWGILFYGWDNDRVGA